MRPVFILSDFRSGSTLLRYVIDSHPAICCPSEIRLGSLCQSIYKVIDLTATKDDAATKCRSVRRLVDEIMSDYCKRKGKQSWCDKSPGNLEILSMLAAVFDDAHYVCLYRHALDQVSSAIEMFPAEFFQPFLVRHDGNAVAAAVDRWCTKTERLLAFEHANAPTAIRVTYEGFVREPEAEASRIFEFLGLKAVEGITQAAFEREHDRGPADFKIAQTRSVKKDRSGRGSRLDLSTLPEDLRRRLDVLLNGLGYRNIPPPPGPDLVH